MKSTDYMEARGDGWYVRDSRVSLDSIIYSFREGLSPEAIARECFPTLSLEQVYGAITGYLANRAEFDAYLAGAKAKAEREAVGEPVNSDISERMAHARRELLRATA